MHECVATADVQVLPADQLLFGGQSRLQQYAIFTARRCAKCSQTCLQ